MLVWCCELLKVDETSSNMKITQTIQAALHFVFWMLDYLHAFHDFVMGQAPKVYTIFLDNNGGDFSNA